MGIINCRYDGPPKLLTDPDALNTLETSCGMIYNGREIDLNLCIK